MVIDRIVADLHLQPDDVVLEIGPGLGALTLPLLAEHKRLDVIEIDRDLAAYWRSYAAKDGAQRGETLTVHEIDALRFHFPDFAQAHPERKIRVVGNLPYNISSPLLFNLQASIQHVQDQHFMLQKEVVDRMVAQPGHSDFSRLSVMLQATYAMQCLQLVAPTAFEPAPRVWSAIVRMVPLAQAQVSAALWPTFASVVAQAFSQRRKMLRGVLKVYSAQLEQVGIDGTLRAEDVSVVQYAALSQCVLDAVATSQSLKP